MVFIRRYAMAAQAYMFLNANGNKHRISGSKTSALMLTVVPLLIVFLLPALALTQNTGNSRVVFFDFKVTSVTSDQKIEFVKSIREMVSRGSGYSVVPQAEVLKTLGVSQYAKMFSCASPDCARQYAPLLRADIFIWGGVELRGQVWLVNLKGFNVQSGAVTNVKKQYSTSFSRLIGVDLNNAVDGFLSQIAGGDDKGYSTAGSAPGAGSGDIYISSLPADGAEILIDGKSSAQKTPATIRGIKPGKHLITLIKDGLVGADTIELKPDDLLRLEIQMERGNGSIKVFSEPAGAQVLVHGKTAGITPVKIDGIGSGTNHVRVAADGYFPLDTIVTVPVSRTGELSVKLKPCAYIKISVFPEKAGIFINNVKVEHNEGLGKISTLVSPGTIVVKAEADSFDVWACTLKVAANEQINLSPVLKYRYGRVKIYIAPATAKIFIDGTEISGEWTNDSVSVNLLPGKIQIRAEADSFAPALCTLDVVQEKIKTIRFKLKPLFGKLLVCPSPSNAGIYINGLKTNVVSAGGQIEAGVNPGQVFVEIRADSFETYLCTLDVAAGEQKRIDVKLKSQFGKLSIGSTPEAANVYVDDDLKGTTPWVTGWLAPGKYMLRLEKDLCVTINDTVTVIKDSLLNLDYPLMNTSIVLEAKYMEKRKEKKAARIKLVLRISSGTAFAAFGAASIFNFVNKNQALSIQDEMQNQYNSATEDFDWYEQQFNKAKSDAEKQTVYSWVFAGAAVLSAAGFGLTFIF